MHSVFECVLYNRIVYFYMSWQKLSCARTGKCIINFYGALCTMCLAFSYIYKYTNHPALQTHSHTHVLYYSSRINEQYADEPYECFTIISSFFLFSWLFFVFIPQTKWISKFKIMAIIQSHIKMHRSATRLHIRCKLYDMIIISPNLYFYNWF